MTEPRTTGRREPVYNWSDALFALGLVIPAAAVALLVTKAVLLVLPAQPGDAVRALALEFLAYGLWFLGLWRLLSARYAARLLPALGFTLPWPRMGLTLWVGPGLVALVLTLGWVLQTPAVDSTIERLLTDRFSVILVGVFATTFGPLAEELIFRGFLQPLLVRSCGVAAGIALASAPFALAHGPQYQWSWRHMLLLFVASSGFGLTRWLSGSTAASTLAHSMYNLILYLAFLMQRKDLFS